MNTRTHLPNPSSIQLAGLTAAAANPLFSKAFSGDRSSIFRPGLVRAGGKGGHCIDRPPQVSSSPRPSGGEAFGPLIRG